MTILAPRPNPLGYDTPLGTRWEKEKAEAGGAHVFDLPTDPKVLGPWVLGECVGKGASGRVKIAKHTKTGQLAAVKILPTAPVLQSRASYDQQCAANNHRLGIDKEIIMLKLMKHPNIIRIYDVYEGYTDLYIVLEYVEGGELFDYLVNKGRLDEDTAWTIFRQIIHGLNYAHTFSIIHRDLKLENILMASIDPPLVKIVDWGMAAFAHPSLVLETSCGSPHYASPEIAHGSSYQGTATDIWSCGVILYTLLVGQLPFDDKDTTAVLRKVMAGRYDMPPNINPQIQDLLSRMLVIDAERRITMADILMHPWLATPRHRHHLQIYRWPDPPLPPSPSRLARPIASPDLIDPELFQSLRIIWGRHSDSQGKSIVRDLCSPPGYGEHAKAFYYLLSNYRKEEWRHGSEDSLSDSDNSSRSNSSSRERYTIGRLKMHFSDGPGLSGTDETCHSSEHAVACNYTMKSEYSGVRSSHADASSRTSCQGHCLLDVVVSRPPLKPAGELSQNRRRGYTFAADSSIHRSAKGDFSQVSCSHERCSVEARRSGRPRAATIAHANTTSPSCVSGSHDVITCQRAHHQSCQTSEATRHLEKQGMTKPYFPTSAWREKENCDLEGWTMIDVEDARDPVGRKSAESKHSARKSRLNRPPPLDLSPLRRRKSAPSPAYISHSSSRFNFPPPVGELKGWFSNLFSWKARSGTLISHQGMSRTYEEVTKTLKELGVLVQHCGTESRSDCQILKCHIGSSPHQLVADVYLKPTRFRVELSIPSSLVGCQTPGRSPASPDKSFDFSNHSPPGSKQPYNNSRAPERRCYIVLVHEKGSTSAFKTILRKFRETYSESMDFSYDTPFLVSSPYL
ncbi:kinase-like domain-containing protein [Cyathus striatus]|nr:kinase-like domain-containing protein [Cyathus striatus]